jgi:hypothetical protein
MERYFYFGEATVETTGENAMYPLSSFLGMTPAGAATTTMHFKSRNGALTDDGVVVTHTGHIPKVFMAEVVEYLQRNQKNPFLIIKDGVSGAEVTSKIVSVAVTTAA